MSASTIMMVAVVAAILGRWANNKPVGTAKMVVEVVFAIIVIAFLDQGPSAPVARGFAWLFLTAVLLSNHSILTGLSKATGQTGGGTVII